MSTSIELRSLANSDSIAVDTEDNDNVDWSETTFEAAFGDESSRRRRRCCDCPVRIWLLGWSKCGLAFADPAREREFLVTQIRSRRRLYVNVVFFFAMLILIAVAWILMREDIDNTNDVYGLEVRCLSTYDGYSNLDDNFTGVPDFGCFDGTRLVMLVCFMGAIGLCTQDLVRETRSPAFFVMFWCILVLQIAQVVDFRLDSSNRLVFDSTTTFTDKLERFLGVHKPCQVDVLAGGDFDICFEESVNLCNLTRWAKDFGSSESFSLVSSLTALWFQCITLQILPLPQRSTLFLQLIPIGLLTIILQSLFREGSPYNCGNQFFVIGAGDGDLDSCETAINTVVLSTVLAPITLFCFAIPIVGIVLAMMHERLSRQLFIAVSTLHAEGTEIEQAIDPFAFNNLTKWVRSQETQNAISRTQSRSFASVSSIESDESPNHSSEPIIGRQDGLSRAVSAEVSFDLYLLACF